MKKFLAVLLVSTLAFAFSSKAQIIKKFTIGSTLVEIDDGFTSGELTTLTTTSTYPNGSSVQTGQTDLPGTDAGCGGTTYACNLYVKLPAGNTSSDADILAAINTARSGLGWPGCGTTFTFSIAGGTNNASAKWFCKD